jgi:hypothetical protein
MPDVTQTVAAQTASGDTVTALSQHLLRRAPAGRELRVLRRWRAKLQAQRSAGEAEVTDSDGRSWRLDDTTFVAFDCLEHELIESALAEVVADKGNLCIFCGSPSAAGQAYCYGCGRDSKAVIRAPVMEASWIRAHAGGGRRSSR